MSDALRPADEALALYHDAEHPGQARAAVIALEALKTARAAILEDLDQLEQMLNTPVPSRQRDLIHQMLHRKRAALHETRSLHGEAHP